MGGRILVALTGFLAALAGWLWLVQDVPSRTAFIFFADAYPAPFAPLGWIDEDRDRFESLDGLTLQVESAGFGSSLSGTPWDGLEAAIRATRSQIEKSGVLILDVRGLGAVDPQGLPALIPPTADPFDDATWISLSDFCRHVQEAGAKHVTLILDCLPTCTHWASGWLNNEFPTAVAAWAARPEVAEKFAEFTIFCRGGNGETRWRSRSRKGSLLQQALWQGLAGAADEAGNTNGNVEQAELVTYLRKVMPTPDPVAVAELDSSAGRLAHALPQRRRVEIARNQSKSPDLDDSASDSRLAIAWQQCEDLLRSKRWQKDLPATARLLRALAWWEENLWSGSAGVAESAATTREVTRWLSYLQRQSETNELPPDTYPLLALQRHTGAADEKYHAAEIRWDELSLAEDRLTFSQRASAIAETDLLRTTSLRQMALLLATNAPAGTWRKPQLIHRAIAQREQFEQLAVPDDIRVSRRLTAQLASIRNQNLAAFDELQIGGPSQLISVADALNQTGRLLTSCSADSEELHRQLTMCDRVRLELPFLAEWAANRDAVATDRKHRLVNRVLLPLIAGLNDLDDRLHPANCCDEATASAAAEVERNWDALRSDFETEWQRLLELRQLSSADLDALESLLKVPLLTSKDDEKSRSPAQQRMVLLRKLVAPREPAPGDVHPIATPQSQRQILDRWTVHPALALLEGLTRQSATSATAGPAEDWNREFRSRIRAAEQLESQAADGHDGGREARAQLLASRRGIGFARNSSNVWAAEYRKLAWADLLLWLADGALTEFWGPEPQSGEPLMAQQVDRLLTVVSGITTNRSSEVQSIRQGLTAALTAAESGLIVDAESLTPVNPAERLSSSVSVQGSRAASALPAGTARIGIQHLDQSFPPESAACRLADVRTGPTTRVAIPIDPRIVQSSFNDGKQPLLAEVWFRGNTYRSSFRVIPAGGRVTEVDVDPTARTSFAVKSQRRQGAAMTFILDCSASMQETIPREGEAGQSRKLTAAISALQSLLLDLSGKPDASIGVMLYGHRASHDPKAQQVLLQKRYASKFTVPDGLQPYADVESILPPGRFGPAELGEVASRLEAVLPWGETPLYLAVTRAAAEFQAQPSDTQRHIVVITDGHNYQFNPPPNQRVEYAEALSRALAVGAKVHVIGFAMSASEKQAASGELSNLASQTGGTAHLDVSRASELTQKLRALLGPASFTWTATDGQTHSSSVNQAVICEGPFPTRISVKYESAVAHLELHGGEAVQLLGDVGKPSATELESADYTALNPQLVPLTGGASHSEKILVGIHQPRRLGRDAVFEFSLRRADHGYMPRPAGYMASIQPLDDTGVPRGAAYECRGREYVPGLPIPVVRVKTESWPIEASQASVQFSIVDAASAAREQIQLPQPSATPLVVSSQSLPGVQWEIRQTSDFVQCVLRHQAQSLGCGRLSVDWCSGPPLRTIRRRLDSEARIEVHTFIFDHPAGRDATAQIGLTQASTSAMRTMARPLRVSMSRDESLIAPTAQAPQALAAPVIPR